MFFKKTLTEITNNLLQFYHYSSYIIGQGCSNSKGKLAGWRTLAYNTVYTIIFSLCYIINAYTMENKLGYEGYSFVSRMNFCCNLYITPLLGIIINILICKNRKDIASCYAKKTAIINELDKLNINTTCQLMKTIGIFCFEILMGFIFLILDISLHGRNFSIIFWLCAYLPGISITIYFKHIYIFLHSCRTQFLSINKYLENFDYSDLSCNEKVSINKENKKPLLVRKENGEENTIFDKIFEQHSRLCDTVENMNNTCGYPFLFLIGTGFAIWLSTFYNMIMDMLMVAKGKPIMTRTVYVCDHWALAYAIGVILFFEICADISEASGNTSIVLHKLQNLYPVLQESGEIYSLQLLHKKLTLTAAGYFVLERSVLLEILTTQATYFIILIQL